MCNSRTIGFHWSHCLGVVFKGVRQISTICDDPHICIPHPHTPPYTRTPPCEWDNNPLRKVVANNFYWVIKDSLCFYSGLRQTTQCVGSIRSFFRPPFLRGNLSGVPKKYLKYKAERTKRTYLCHYAQPCSMRYTEETVYRYHVGHAHFILSFLAYIWKRF